MRLWKWNAVENWIFDNMWKFSMLCLVLYIIISVVEQVYKKQ